MFFEIFQILNKQHNSFQVAGGGLIRVVQNMEHCSDLIQVGLNLIQVVDSTTPHRSKRHVKV